MGIRGKQKICRKKVLGDSGFVNRNCWLTKNVGHPPSSRCQYCELEFKDCLFSRYLAISVILAFLLLLISYLVEGNISRTLVLSIFVLIITYGYFFNKSTEAIIEASFAEKKSKEAFENLTVTLKQRVADQTGELKARAKHLEKLLKMREEFLDIASHQLKTPISVIRGTLSMFRDGSMDKVSKTEQQKFMDNIYHKTEKLNVIIADILRASEIESEDFKIDAKTAKPADLAMILKAVYDDLRELAEEKGLRLELNLPAKPAPQVLTSADFLEQAFYNLIDNAIKYTAQGRVGIDLSVKGNLATVKISDTGIGIPLADRKKMFEKFSRGKNAVNMYTDGSGLGLFIVKRMIEAHPGGKISFESVEGRGTSFTVVLPIAK